MIADAHQSTIADPISLGGSPENGATMG